MYCSHCGAEVKENEAFCGECGNRIEPVTGEKPKKPNGAAFVILGIFLAVLIIGAAVFLAMHFWVKVPDGSGPEEPKTAVMETLTENASSEGTEHNESTDDTAETETDTAEPESTIQEDATAVSEEAAVKTDHTEIHSYEIVTANVSWQEASEAAAGKGGYLARINTPEEYSYILDMLNSGNYEKLHLYIGGNRKTGSLEYHWVDTDGTDFDEQLNDDSLWYSEHWFQDEPSFQDVNMIKEDAAVQENVVNLFNVSGTWYFNDTSDDILAYYSYLEGQIGYIIEYE